MKLSDVSIQRPVFATMMILALIVLGLFSFMKLNIDLFPNIDVPYVTITSVLPGAGPEQIETDVTKKIEDAVNTIGGIDHIMSTSQEGVSIVIIQFKLEVDGRQAAQEVREKIAAIRSDMPDDLDDPVVQRIDPSSTPIFDLTVSGKRSEKDITTFAKNVIKKRLENVPGVGRVDLVGGAEREVQIEVDAASLRAYDLSIQDVIQAVSNSNMEVPAGNLNRGPRQTLLRTMGKLVRVEDFNRIVVATPNGKPVYLSEVAHVVDGVKERTSLTRRNGEAAVGLSVLKQSGSNTVRVAEALQQQVTIIQKELPPDLTLSVARDNSTYIRDMVRDVLFDIFYGGLLAVVVVFLFLANARATVISAIALPTSIIASFIVMSALDFTLNMMTLLALSLAVGLLIDDAIVVIENIYRHMQKGESAMQAAKSATSEIGLAVMATTFTIVAVFVPVAFIPGIVGRVFYQFGITVSVAVLVSLFVAFTLTPMLSSRWLHKEDEELKRDGNLLQKGLYYFNHFFELLAARYKRAIAWSLHRRKTVLFGAIGVFIASLFLMGFVGSAFFPESDQGEVTVNIEAAAGSSLERTSDICARVEKLLSNRKDVTSTLTTIGSGNNPVTKASILAKLVKKRERDKSAMEIQDELRADLGLVAGAKISFGGSGHGPSGGAKPLSLSVRGDNVTMLSGIASQVERIVRSTPGAADVSNSLEISKPEYRIRIDRERASDLGVNVGLVASTVRSMVDGYVATEYEEGDEQFDTRVRLAESDRSSIDNIGDLTVKSNKDAVNGKHILIPISSVADIQAATGPSVVNRYDRQREIRIEADLAGGTLLGNAMKSAMNEVRKLTIPPGYTVEVTGQGQMQTEAFANIFMALILAIIFVYIVLAAQFESFSYPFAIMFSLPMALIGAVFALLTFGSALSVMSLIGIIMLMGLVTKNGILLVDFTNTLRGRGLERTEALVQAGATRLRPILMTTFAMIFGMIPVAFALGEGSEFRSPMGQAVIGGLVTSTLLTLFIVPVVYSVLDDLSFSRLFKRAKSKSPIQRTIVPARQPMLED